MKTELKGDFHHESHICPECGSYVDEYSYLMECDHCLSKYEE